MMMMKTRRRRKTRRRNRKIREKKKRRKVMIVSGVITIFLTFTATCFIPLSVGAPAHRRRRARRVP